jgi:hypothetical protein
LALSARAIGLSPNSLTIASLISGVAAAVSIAFGAIGIFLFLWTVSYLLDFADGTLARMTRNLSRFPIDIDHLADVVKINLISLGFCMHYSNQDLWIVGTLAITTLGIWDLVNRTKLPKASEAVFEPEHKPPAQTSLFIRGVDSTRDWIKKSGTLSKILRVLLSYHAHTLLFFFLIPFSQSLTSFFFCYLIFVALLNSTIRLASMKG